MKIMIKHIIPILLVTAAISSCERNTLELPADSGNDPVFRIDMNVDNSDLQAVAGKDDFYNYTDFDLGQDEVYTFTGLLSTNDCSSSCSNAYRFKFRNYEAGATNVDVNQSLSPKSYTFKNEQEPTQDAVELHMNINTQAQSPVFEWLVNDIVSTQQDVSDILVLNVGVDNLATLNVFDEATGLSSFSTQQIQLDENTVGISSSIHVEQIEGDSVNIQILHTEGSEFSPLVPTFWTVEDLQGGLPSLPNGAETSFSIRIGNGKSIQNTTSFLSLLSGTKTSVGIDLQYDSATDQVIFHDANFDYNVEKRIAQGSDLALQSFEFEMYDENAELYSSAKGDQSADSFFKILKVEPFIQNDNGQKTVKVTCQFSCQVFSDNGDVKQITDANAVIAVAIPE